VMASHTKSELRWAAGVLARAIRTAAPAASEREPEPVAVGRGESRVFDGLSEAA